MLIPTDFNSLPFPNQAVRELFSTARRSGRPTLLFFDEFESLAAKRGIGELSKLFSPFG